MLLQELLKFANEQENEKDREMCLDNEGMIRCKDRTRDTSSADDIQLPLWLLTAEAEFLA